MISKNTKVLFFEIRGTSLLRFPFWLSNALKKLNSDLSFVFLVDDKIGKEIKSHLSDELDNVDFYQSSFISSVSSYKDQLEKIRPKIVVIFAHRLPDIAVMVAAKQLDIPTVYFQHGLYIPFMKRTIGLFFSNLLKALRYFFYAISIGFNTGIGKISSLVSFVKVFIFGHKIREVGLPIDKITADACLVYGNHWVDYHVEHYGYSNNTVKVVGTPDLDGVNLDSSTTLNSTNLVNKFCYVAQTLVEDGRLERSVMENFLKNLACQIKLSNSELLIKLHPRSDISLYSSLECNYKFCKKFPAADTYIGHYSTILIRGVAYSEKFLLVNFKGHKIPEYILMLANKVIDSNDQSSLRKAIELLRIKPSNAQALIEKRKRIANYFDVSEKSSFDRAAIKILSLLEY